MGTMDWFNLIYKIGLIIGGLAALSLIIRNAVRDGIIQAYNRIEEINKNTTCINNIVQKDNVEGKPSEVISDTHE